MRTPPTDLDERAVIDAVADAWGLDVVGLRHQPVGFGSHHWTGAGRDGRARWWITVDDLTTWGGPDREVAFVELRTAMQSARDLADLGCSFVVAPIPSRGGDVVVRIGGRWTVAVHPIVDGRAHDWGEVLAPEQLDEIVDVLAALHAVPVTAVGAGRHDPGAFDQRSTLEQVVDDRVAPRDVADPDAIGPFAAGAARLVDEHRDHVRRALERFDETVDAARRRGRPLVVTHGEPHPGNLLAVGGRWLLVDWDTARLGPPERDLWMLVSQDVYPDPPDLDADTDAVRRGSAARTDRILARYERATGNAVDRELLDAYRVRWDLADTANYVAQFARPHVGSADDDEAWTNLGRSLTRLREAVDPG